MTTAARSELTTAVAADLVWVAHYWDDLAESRLPGTARPWRQPHLTPEQAEERDQQARIERLERVGVMPGEHPAPVDVGVLDTMASILWDAVQLADAVTEHHGLAPLEYPSTAYADARPYLDYAAAHLPDEIADWAAPIARRLVDQTARTLALVLDGQLLDVVCPWCRGVTAEAPAGGARTWRIRNLLAEQDCRHGHPRRFCPTCEQHIAIVCEGACEPPHREVGTWWRGQPCWPLTDWENLARRVMSADEQITRAREAVTGTR
ncbi:hypothetical protein Skr01_36450 [Sphaerisporangium krabiense]|uniref:Uncharacterized protein n=1 Tax=Sphaerisporangium krabiense TaxID=763782 RepID=A0A7W8Z397_9ACTN|nr:hypothetical protein [Sphaerisporangium krabiense]MBB5626639.1 hypothetical protein [Sphaerisporangium krabiense]GII63560.1 hypothetical protein Skr01_36450 [Sphaerisporangium krabiense]